MQQWRFTILGLSFLLCALFLFFGCANETPTAKEEASLPPISDVRVEEVQAQVIPNTLEAVGTVRSVQHTTLSAHMTAHVTAIHVQVGESVRAGQPVITLDARETQSQVRRMQAGVQESREALDEVEQSLRSAQKAFEVATARQELTTATLDRYRALLQRHSVAPQEYDEVAARAKVADAEVQRAEAEIATIKAKKHQVLAKVLQAEAESTGTEVVASYTTVTAPFSGLVVAKAAEVGSLAAPGVPLLEIEEEQYLLEVAVEESAIQHLLVGHTVEVTIPALGQSFVCPIHAIVPTADPASRTILVKIALPPTSGLHSGLYSKAVFTVGQRTAIQVPQETIVTRGQLQGVFVLTPQETASLRFVKAGKVSGGMIEILAGLAAGEQVIVPSAEKIVDGRRIIPQKSGAHAG